MQLSKFQLEILEEAYQHMETYILYIKQKDPQLHEEADGGTEAKLKTATIILTSAIELA